MSPSAKTRQNSHISRPLGLKARIIWNLLFHNAGICDAVKNMLAVNAARMRHCLRRVAERYE